jgi:hypothetical protein
MSKRRRHLSLFFFLILVTVLGACDIYSFLRNPLDGSCQRTLTLTLLSGGTPGTTDGTGSAAQFQGPSGICTDGTSLYVAESGNHCIRKIVIGTGVVTTLAGLGGAGPGYIDATGTAARFDFPQGICWDGTYLHVADTDNNSIRRVTAAGVVTTFAGDIAGSAGTTDGVGAAARLDGPMTTCFLGWGLLTDSMGGQAPEGGRYLVNRMISLPVAVVTAITTSCGGGFYNPLYDGSCYRYGFGGNGVYKTEISSSSTTWDYFAARASPDHQFMGGCFVGTDLYVLDYAKAAIYRIDGTPPSGWLFQEWPSRAGAPLC